MMICPQCNGIGIVKPVNEALNAPNGVVFTAQTQVPETLCNFCVGTGTFTGAGS